MSRSLARNLHALIRLALLPQGRVGRGQTLARLLQRLDQDTAVTIQTAHGPLKLLPLRGPHLAAAALDFDNEEPETLAFIDAMAPGETLWDIGAAAGLLSMYAALRGDVQVLAFEPKATSYGLLVEHLALNGLGEKVFPLCVALADKTETTHLFLSQMAPGSGGNSVAGAPNQFGLYDSMFAQGALAYRIDDFRQAFGLAAPDHIKIDVDGIEGAILRGAEATLPLVKSVIIEVEGLNASEAGERIEAPLFAAGFKEDVAVRDQGSARNRLYRRV
jgi:FkbM family methyltransferase